LGVNLLTIELWFSPREISWLYNEAESQGVTVTELIRNRALRLDDVKRDEEGYQRFFEVKERGAS